MTRKELIDALLKVGTDNTEVRRHDYEWPHQAGICYLSIRPAEPEDGILNDYILIG